MRRWPGCGGLGHEQAETHDSKAAAKGDVAEPKLQAGHGSTIAQSCRRRCIAQHRPRCAAYKCPPQHKTANHLSPCCWSTAVAWRTNMHCMLCAAALLHALLPRTCRASHYKGVTQCHLLWAALAVGPSCPETDEMAPGSQHLCKGWEIKYITMQSNFTSLLCIPQQLRAARKARSGESRHMLRWMADTVTAESARRVPCSDFHAGSRVAAIQLNIG